MKMNKDGEFSLEGFGKGWREKERTTRENEKEAAKEDDWDITLQACLGSSGKEEGSHPFICRDVFRILGEKDPKGKEHKSTISLCCASCFRIRPEDLALCENSLSEFSITKGHITEIDLPSLANCVKMQRFVLIQDRLEDSRAQEKMRLTRGIPVLPSTLTELHLSGIDVTSGPALDISASLIRVTALETMVLRRLSLRNPVLNFCPGFSALRTLKVEDVVGFKATAAFWSNCRSLESAEICGVGKAAPFFGYASELPDFLFPGTLTTLILDGCDVPELPPSICACAALTSLSVTSCGLKRLPNDLPQLSSLDNLSLTDNDLHLEGIAVLEKCDFLTKPTRLKGTRAVSLMRNRLPAGCPVEVSVVAYLKALPRPDKLYSGLRHYEYRKLEAATKGFSASELLNDEGSFGPVYKGTIGATQQIAVKVMAEATLSSEDQMRAELGALQLCRHPK